MNERIKVLEKQATTVVEGWSDESGTTRYYEFNKEKFAELIVREMCGMMEQAEDDGYHCFEASERPTEYIEWLRDWQVRFEKHFGVEE